MWQTQLRARTTLPDTLTGCSPPSTSGTASALASTAFGLPPGCVRRRRIPDVDGKAAHSLKLITAKAFTTSVLRAQATFRITRQTV